MYNITFKWISSPLFLCNLCDFFNIAFSISLPSMHRSAFIRIVFSGPNLTYSPLISFLDLTTLTTFCVGHEQRLSSWRNICIIFISPFLGPWIIFAISFSNTRRVLLETRGDKFHVRPKQNEQIYFLAFLNLTFWIKRPDFAKLLKC
jgi:hypothetical protein